MSKLLEEFEQHLSLILSIVDRNALINARQSINISKENKTDEANGEDVTVLDNEGRIFYSTYLCTEKGYCDSCSYLRFIDSPDPLDPLRNSDQQPYCCYTKKNIGDSVTVFDVTKICSPDWCPKKLSK